MLRTYKADLHVHTCLSPCTELDMTPRRIVRQAKTERIDLIGICDHNSSENSHAAIQAGNALDIRVIPGMEVTSQEEVHILALFDELENALELQEYIYRFLPGENDEEAFGRQVVMNENDEVLKHSDKLLIGATTLSLEKIIRFIHRFNGIAIASHIDRESFSIISQLGFIPEDLELDAVEVSPHITIEDAGKKYPGRHPIISSSDAHYPEDIGNAFTTFILKDGTVAEIKMALNNEKGRRIIH